MESWLSYLIEMFGPDELTSLCESFVNRHYRMILDIAEKTEVEEGQNVRTTLDQHNSFEIVMVKWKGISRSPMHVHQRKDEQGISDSVVIVVSGSILEERVKNGKVSLSIAKKDSPPIVISSDEKHEITSLEDSITINIYSPPAYNRIV